MRIGFLSPFHRDRIAFARMNGFGSVELLVKPEDPFMPGHDGWQDRAAEVRAAYQEAGLRISCIGGFYVNHLDADSNAARAHHDRVRHCIALARELGVGTVGGFAGRVMNAELEASLPRFKEVWSEHAKAASDTGVRIAFEHCPMGTFHLPFGGINCICTPAMWERCFDAVPSEAIGLEWDASHLVCQMIDPVTNLRRFGSKVYHVHAKDAKVYHDVLSRYGICHPGAIEHCFPGLGDSDWAAIVKELLRARYRGDLNIEGWHDEVYRNHEDGPQLEDTGLLAAKRCLEPFVDGT